MLNLRLQFFLHGDRYRMMFRPINRTIYRRAVLTLVVFHWCAFPASSAVLFSDNFNRPEGLITNEYAYWNPTDPSAVKSSDWQMTSGSFFISGNAGWSGVPDDCNGGSGSPNAK